MKQLNEHIIYNTLNKLILEQETPEEGEDNTSEEKSFSPFSKEEELFLGTFDTHKSKTIGVLYSITDIGIREFIARSGKSFNCTPGVLLQLLRDKIVKIVPAGGYGTDTDYTIELQLSLDDVAGLGGEAAGGDAAAGGGDEMGGGDDAGGEPMAGGDAEPPPGLEGDPMEWITNYKDIISESIKTAKKIIKEKKSKKKSKVKLDDRIKIHVTQSRTLQRLPKEFIHQLKRVIKMMSKKTYNKLDQERLIADILDTMQYNFNLTDKQVRRSFEFHKNQKRLQKYLEK
jgi:hypothetical protein